MNLTALLAISCLAGCLFAAPAVWAGKGASVIVSHSGGVRKKDNLVEEDGHQPLLLNDEGADSFTNSIGMKFVKIAGGCFQMGDTFSEGDDDETPVHRVCVAGFYMGAYEVTQQEYKAIMGVNPSRFNSGDTYPVELVSWDDTQQFIEKLHNRDGLEYSLPTEAQWEYAAREGGKKLRFGDGKDCADPARINFDGSKDHQKKYSHIGEYRGKTVSVDSVAPNSLGLYHMSGNVWEWCQDSWHEGYKGAPADGSAWVSGEENPKRVFRGGSWDDDPERRIPNGFFGVEAGMMTRGLCGLPIVTPIHLMYAVLKLVSDWCFLLVEVFFKFKIRE